jgi:hypothetical protein
MISDNVDSMQRLFSKYRDEVLVIGTPTKIGASPLTKISASPLSKYLICSHLVPHSRVSNKGIVCHTMVIIIKNSKHSSLPGAGEILTVR